MSDVLAFAIKLYVKLIKDKLELQVELDASKEMDMCIKVKKLGANMREQVALVLRPFLDFMDCFKHSKAHNMVALMLDLQFKNLRLVGNYVGHYFAIVIAFAYDRKFVLLTLKTLYKKHHGWSNAFSLIM